MNSFRDLIVWQKSFTIVKSTYSLTATFPSDQRFGLSNQMQRAAVSIMSNIAEGSRRSKSGWIYFCQIALGSTAELEAQLLLSESLGYGSKEVYALIFEEIDHVSRILQSILSKSS